MRKLTLAAVAAIPFLVAGCATVRDLAAAAFEKPKLTFQSVSVQSFDLEGATLGFEYLLENPNSMGLKLARLGYALEVEGAHVVDGKFTQGLAIPARGAAPVTFPVHVKFKDVPGFVRLVTSARDQIQYRLSGTAGVDTPIGVVELPLSHTSTLALPKLPSFALERVAVRSASLTDLALDVRVKVSNPNRFPIPPGSLDYALALAGTQVASGDAAALAKVAAGSAATVTLPVKVSLLGAGRAIYQAVQGGSTVPVALSGKANVAGIEIPLQLQGKVPAGK
ncbi:MAG TPA: LEA type 2 family protein [Anaeromyxobacteraceae bacterium]|nr:LEA type 2 family protein [Anaeromyxobacteraceae bacterium]